MNFVAVDVETANADFASICQVGIVVFKNGKASESWESLVNPEDFFDGINVSIHGIDGDSVKSSPTFPAILNIMRNYFENSVIVSHTPFDKVSLARASEKYGESINCPIWLDTAKVVRRAWPNKYATRGYGLAKVAQNLGIEFLHHNAKEDARAAGEILIRVIKETGINVAEWVERVKNPIGSDVQSGDISRKGNPDGNLVGEVVVFTGALSIPRREAADLAAQAGCEVSPSVNKRTTLLIVGDVDIRNVLNNYEKSSKYRKAEHLIANGQSIRIIGESDFTRLV